MRSCLFQNSVQLRNIKCKKHCILQMAKADKAMLLDMRIPAQFLKK
ncbi:hypothetical protein T11_4751 [Trichinella zimbabwensis]|uniref:Uncharacterized protein n=1 Tax=Trichinella zimbabwensis TaxID=268475 RepID=A0A0V1GKT6_9BILA|nr:hypothetical protein T11_4751 [Trichinella zimbabwensis]